MKLTGNYRDDISKLKEFTSFDLPTIIIPAAPRKAASILEPPIGRWRVWFVATVLVGLLAIAALI